MIFYGNLKLSYSKDIPLKLLREIYPVLVIILATKHRKNENTY